MQSARSEMIHRVILQREVLTSMNPIAVLGFSLMAFKWQSGNKHRDLRKKSDLYEWKKLCFSTWIRSVGKIKA